MVVDKEQKTAVIVNVAIPTDSNIMKYGSNIGNLFYFVNSKCNNYVTTYNILCNRNCSSSVDKNLHLWSLLILSLEESKNFDRHEPAAGEVTYP